MKGPREDLKDLGRKNRGNGLMNSQDLSDLNKLADKMDSLDAKIAEPERRRIGFPIPGVDNVSGETAKDKGKEKAEEVKKQEAKANTSREVNSTLRKNKG